MRFEWNFNKAEANLSKHGVSFEEATTVFGDRLSGTFPDPEHSISEERWITVGMSVDGRLLVVAHTENDETFRIISARVATTNQ